MTRINRLARDVSCWVILASGDGLYIVSNKLVPAAVTYVWSIYLIMMSDLQVGHRDYCWLLIFDLPSAINWYIKVDMSNEWSRRCYLSNVFEMSCLYFVVFVVLAVFVVFFSYFNPQARLVKSYLHLLTIQSNFLLLFCTHCHYFTVYK